MRLNKFIAQSGACSRRQADKSVQGGSVTVNGLLELNPAYQVSKDDDVKINLQSCSINLSHIADPIPPLDPVIKIVLFDKFILF